MILKLRSRLLHMLLWAVAASLATAALYGASAQGAFDRTLKVTGAPEIEVTTGIGSITVRPGDSSTVRVRWIIKATDGWLGSGNAGQKMQRIEANLPVLQNGNFIRIGRIEDPDLRRNISISFELEVPPTTQLKCTTGSGNLSITGIQGPVKASSGNGSLELTSIGGDVFGSTGSGNVRAASIHGEVHLTSGSGSIQALGVAGPFFISTGSGDVTLQETGATRGDQVSESLWRFGKKFWEKQSGKNDGNAAMATFAGGKVNTGSGNVRLSGVNGSLLASTGSGNIIAGGEATGDWRLRTSSGNINVQLPPQASFEINAHTNSGRISTKLPVTVQGTAGKGTLQGVVGKGGPRLDLQAASGNIEVD